MSKSVIQQIAFASFVFSPLLVAIGGVFLVCRYADADPVLLWAVFLLSAARHAFLVGHYEGSLKYEQGRVSDLQRALSDAHKDVEFYRNNAAVAAATQEQWKQLADARRKASEEGLAAGRAEALHLLLSVDAESIDDYIGSRQTMTDDYDSFWREDKLRELFRVSADNAGQTESYIYRLENELYWSKPLEELPLEPGELGAEEADAVSAHCVPAESTPASQPCVLWLHRGAFLCVCLAVGALLGFACLLCAVAFYFFSVVFYDTDHTSTVAAAQHALLFLLAVMSFSLVACVLDSLAHKVENRTFTRERKANV